MTNDASKTPAPVSIRTVDEAFDCMSRVEGKLEALLLLQAEVRDELNRRPCLVHEARLKKLEELAEARRPPSGPVSPVRSPTGAAHAAVRALEDRLETTERHVLEELQGAEAAAVAAAREELERALAERDAAQAGMARMREEAEKKAKAELKAEEEEALEKRKRNVKWWLDLAKYAIAIIVGSGIAGWVKCELPRAQKPAAAQVQQHQQTPSSAPARR